MQRAALAGHAAGHLSRTRCSALQIFRMARSLRLARSDNYADAASQLMQSCARLPPGHMAALSSGCIPRALLFCINVIMSGVCVGGAGGHGNGAVHFSHHRSQQGGVRALLLYDYGGFLGSDNMMRGCVRSGHDLAQRLFSQWSSRHPFV